MNRFTDINYVPLAVLALFALSITPAVDAKIKIQHKAAKKLATGKRISLSAVVKDKEHAIELVRVATT